MKKGLMVLSVLVAGVVFLGCNPGFLTTEGSVSTTTEAPEYTIEDFHAEIVVYETRMDTIIDARPVETASASGSSHFRRFSVAEEWTETITREEILAAYHRSSFNLVYDEYFEQLITTRDFVRRIKELLENQEGIG